MVTVGVVSRLAVSLAGGGGGGRMGVQLVSSLVLRLELVCHRRQATIGQQGQAASQKITKPQIHLVISCQGYQGQD